MLQFLSPLPDGPGRFLHQKIRACAFIPAETCKAIVCLTWRTLGAFARNPGFVHRLSVWPKATPVMINDLWYKNAIIYCLSVGTYMDANGDGVGDFKGLMRRLDYLHGLGVTAIWLMPFQPSPGATTATTSRTITTSIRATARSATSSSSPTAASSAASASSSTSSSITPPTSIHGSSRRAARTELAIIATGMSGPRRSPADADKGMVFPGVQKSTWTLRQEGRRLVLPPLLRFPARPQHLEPAGAGGDPEDHGLLDPARRLRLPHGRRALRDRDQRRQGAKAGRAVRHAARLPRVPAMAQGRRHHPRRSQRAAEHRHGIFRRRRRAHAHDVQLPGQPASVLCAGRRRQPAAGEGARGHASRGQPPRSGACSCAITTSSISAG